MKLPYAYRPPQSPTFINKYKFQPNSETWHNVINILKLKGGGLFNNNNNKNKLSFFLCVPNYI